MIMESVTTQLLQVTFLALTPTERMAAAKQSWDLSAVETWLTGYAMAALIISVILVFFLSAKHRRSLESFRLKIASLTADIDKLQQEITELSQYVPDEASKQMLLQESEEPVTIRES
jgi:cell division protein FtsL